MPIAFALNPQTLYISTNGQQNTLTLTLTNQTGGPLTLKGGTPVSESQIQPGDPTTCYFNLGSLITEEELAAATVTSSPAGWNSKFFSGRFFSWAVCPKADVTLPNQGSVSFTIADLSAAGQPAPGQFNIDYYNFPGVTNSTTQIQVFLQNAPSGQKDLLLTNGFLTGDAVYTTLDPQSPILNILNFGLSNPSSTQPVVTEPWTANTPVFNITFTYAEPPGDGALTTPALGQKINISIADESQGSWEISQAPSGLYWILKPSTSNPQVFAAGASLELQISNLRTDLPVGSSPGLTNIYVQYANLPGYNDGFFSGQMVKIAGPMIRTFFSDPLSLGSAPSAQGTVYWAADNTSSVAFDGGGIPPGYYKASGNLPATISANGGITITAYYNPQSGVQSPGFPSVTRTLMPSTVSVQTLTLPFGGVGAVLMEPNTAWVFQCWEGLAAGTKYASIDLTSNKVTAFDLGSLIQPPAGSQVGTTAVTPTPDGKAFYAVVGLLPANNPLTSWYLFRIDAQTGAAKLVLSVPPLTGICFPADLAVTPDGSTIYLNWMSLDMDSNWNIIIGGGIWTIDTTKFEITNKYDYAQPPAFLAWPPFLFGTSPDATKALVAGIGALASFDMSAGFKMLNQMIVPYAIPGYLILPFWDVITSNAQSAYFISFPYSGAELDIQQINIDPVSSGFSVGTRLQIGTTPSDLNSFGPLAFSADERLIFCMIDGFLVHDLLTSESTHVLWNEPPMTKPGVLTIDPAQSNKAYLATDSSWITVTVNPWPWTSATQSRTRLARARRLHPKQILSMLGRDVAPSS